MECILQKYLSGCVFAGNLCGYSYALSWEENLLLIFYLQYGIKTTLF